MPTRSSFETKVLTAFAASVLVVTSLAVTTSMLASNAQEANRWVNHTRDVLDGLARTKGDTLQIEFTTQAFRISGDPARLAERDLAIAEREAALERIRQLTSDNPRQQQRWTQLRNVLNERLGISRHVEELRKNEGPEAANRYVATVNLQETRERSYRLMQEMDDS